MFDVDAVAVQTVAAISAAVGAYGAAVLTRAEDAAADETVRLGQRLLARILGRIRRREAFDSAVADVASDTDDPDALAALRLQLRKILAQDPALAADLAAMLPAGPSVKASGARSVAVGGSNYGPITTGDHSPVADPG